MSQIGCRAVSGTEKDAPEPRKYTQMPIDFLTAF
jgi:hypothetical protein